MSFKVIATYKHILKQHMSTSVISSCPWGVAYLLCSLMPSESVENESRATVTSSCGYFWQITVPSPLQSVKMTIRTLILAVDLLPWDSCKNTVPTMRLDLGFTLSGDFFFFGRTLRLSPRTRFYLRAATEQAISFSPTCWLLLPWQASTTGNIGYNAANPVVSTPHRLRSSEIPKPLSVSLVVMSPRHHQPALPPLIGELRQKRY